MHGVFDAYGYLIFKKIGDRWRHFLKAQVRRAEQKARDAQY